MAGKLLPPRRNPTNQREHVTHELLSAVRMNEGECEDPVSRVSVAAGAKFGLSWRRCLVSSLLLCSVCGGLAPDDTEHISQKHLRTLRSSTLPNAISA